MKTKIINLWERLRASYWFLPLVMACAAVVLAVVMVALDQLLGYQIKNGLALIYTGEPEGARTLLSTVAGSMITVAGVTFSITIVALTLASSQFGPRLLNNFMRDTGNQVVLGTFIATFIYCLLVLRSIRSTETNPFVPQLSITVAVLLAIASLGVLIYFFHHVSVSIHVENVIAAVDRDLEGAIERLFPQRQGYYRFETQLREEDDIPENFDEMAHPLQASQGGYVQVIDDDSLMKLACEHNLLIRLEYRAGDFVSRGGKLVSVWSDEYPDEEIVNQIQAAFILGVQRLRLQDVEFAINQLVELAVRALSPGVNDPFTAMACVDRLGEALAHLAQRTIPSAYRYDDQGSLRLITDAVTFAGVVDTAFNQIRQYGRSSVAVTIRLLGTIAVIAEQTQTDQERAALRRQAILIKRGSEEAIPEKEDREDIAEQFEIAMKILEWK